MHRLYGRLLEVYGNGGIDRRGFLGTIGRMAIAAGLAGSVMPLFSRYARAASIRFDGYGGVWQNEFDRLVLQPFTARTGIVISVPAVPCSG